MKIQVCEIFDSFQGEGPSVGRVCTFLRLSGCNLKCRFCDSKYHIVGEEMETEEVINRINESRMRTLVITGGEPMLQQAALAEILPELNSRRIEIETNGTIAPIYAISSLVDCYNVSLKMSNSRNRKYSLVEYSISEYKKLAMENRAIFKFVVKDEKTIDEARGIISDFNLPIDSVYFMPQGSNKRQVAKITNYLITRCVEEKINFTPRLHIMLFNKKRKV